LIIIAGEITSSNLCSSFDALTMMFSIVVVSWAFGEFIKDKSKTEIKKYLTAYLTP
tara:strand:- start:336 stop:503 length:168 start_codon:yes stop_codon:yes gene_type:complete